VNGLPSDSTTLVVNVLIPNGTAGAIAVGSLALADAGDPPPP
jgi:hypothetical protein